MPVLCEIPASDTLTPFLSECLPGWISLEEWIDPKTVRVNYKSKPADTDRDTDKKPPL